MVSICSENMSKKCVTKIKNKANKIKVKTLGKRSVLFKGLTTFQTIYWVSLRKMIKSRMKINWNNDQIKQSKLINILVWLCNARHPTHVMVQYLQLKSKDKQSPMYSDLTTQINISKLLTNKSNRYSFFTKINKKSIWEMSLSFLALSLFYWDIINIRIKQNNKQTQIKIDNAKWIKQ